MNVGQLISGLVLVLFGLFGIFFGLFSWFKNASLLFFIYGVPALIIGLFILFNKKEDYVEPIKLKGGRKNEK